MNKIKSFYVDNPRQAIILTLMVIIVLLIVFNKINNAIIRSKRRKFLEDTRGGVESEQGYVDPKDIITNDGSTIPKINKTQAAQIADGQLAAMKSNGTKEEALFKGLEGLNGKDLVLVYNAFGSQPYDTIFGLLDRSWFGKISGLVEHHDLFGWYIGELGSKDLEKMRSIWKKSSLTF